MDLARDPVSASLVAATRSLRLATRDPELLDGCRRAAGALTQALSGGDRVWFCGNGGSAAEAQHLAAELSGRFLIDRSPLPAEALHVNSSYLTAVANDYGYEQVFSRLVAASVRTGDVLVCLSTSGNSANVVAATLQAQRQGVMTIALTGPGGGRLGELADLVIAAPREVTSTSRIQELHLAIGHTLCEIVERRMFERSVTPTVADEPVMTPTTASPSRRHHSDSPPDGAPGAGPTRTRHR